MRFRYFWVILLCFTCIFSIAIHPTRSPSLAQSVISNTNSCGDFGSARSKAIDCIVFGRQLQNAGQVERAIAAYNQAIQIDENVAVAYYSRGVAQSEQKNWQAAIADFEAATRLNPNLKDAYQRWEDALKALGRASEAEEAYRQAVATANSESTVAYQQQGDAHWDQRQWNEAIEAYQTFIQLDPDWPDTYNKLGIAYYNLDWEASKRIGNFEAAIEAYGTAIALCNRPFIVRRVRISCSADTTVYYKNLASVYSSLGNLFRDQNLSEQARAAYNKANEINPDLIAFRISANPAVEDYNALGKVLHSQERHPEAIDAYNKAIQQIGSADRELAAAVYRNLGLAFDRIDEPGNAIDAYRQAAQLNPTPVQYDSLTRALIKTEQWNELIKTYQNFETELGNIEIWPAGLVGASLETLLLDQECFKEYLAGNVTCKAPSDGRVANILEIPLEEDPLEDYRKFSDSNVEKQIYYSFYIDQLMKAVLPPGAVTEPSAQLDYKALEISERARARALLAFLSKAKAIQINDSVLNQRKLDLEQHIRQLLEQLFSLSSNNTAPENSSEEGASENPTYDVRQEIVQKLEQLQQQYTKLIQEIRDKEPRYGELDPLTPITVNEIQSLLDDDTLLLEYWLGEKASYLWVISEDDVKSYKLEKREEIEQAAQRFYEYLSEQDLTVQPNNRMKAGLTLSRMILKPAVDTQKLEGKRLLIVADGQLHHIPFGALPIPEPNETNTDEIDWNNLPEILLEHNEIVNIPSASTLTLMRQRVAGRAKAPQSLAIVIDPELSGAEREARAIQAEAEDEGIGNESELSVQKFIATDSADNRSTIISNLSNFRLIHFAMHGIANEAHPALSGLMLSISDQSSPQEGNLFLKLADVFKMPPIFADLVVLSSCRTDLETQVQGEGLIGLAKGFLYAGAERVLVSLWNVDDDATSELMASFYDKLIDDGMPPDKALREAQREMLESDRHHEPHYWAGFSLQGEWQKFQQKL